jgi:hypothetical protein
VCRHDILEIGTPEEKLVRLHVGEPIVLPYRRIIVLFRKESRGAQDNDRQPMLLKAPLAPPPSGGRI